MVRIVMAALVVMAALLAPAGAAGDFEPMAATVETSLAGRYNPLGASLTVRPMVRYRLVPPDAWLRRTGLGDQLFAPTGVGFGPQIDTNPAFTRGGVLVELMPAAVWRLRLLAQGILYYGTFNHLMRFDSPNDSFARDELSRKSRSRLFHGPATAWRVLGESLLQVKLWRLFGFDLATAEAWVHHAGGYYYHGEYDLLVAGNGDVILKNIVIGGLVLVDQPKVPMFGLGGFHAITRALRTGHQNQQTGLAFAYTPVVGAPGLASVQLIGLFGFHLQDRHRKNEPYIVLLLTTVL